MPAIRFIFVSLHPRVAIALLSLSLSMTLPSFAQTPAGTTMQRETTLSGQVVDASGKPVGGAQVFAQSRGTADAVHVVADVSGKFRFTALKPGSYVLNAVKEGQGSESSIVVVTTGTQKDARILFESAGPALLNGQASSAQAGQSMDFIDKPTFTVAGVTDWTAVGGHGSDATLRTSEELNREALALRAQRTASANPTASISRDTEVQLRAAVTAAPQSYVANRDLGLHYLGLAQYSQAFPLLQAASRISGGKADDEYHLALALQGTGDFAAARLHIGQALAHKDTGDFHRLAGELDERLGNPLAAVREEQRATRLDASEENYFAWGSELLLHRAIWQAGEVFANGAKAYPGSVRLKTAWGAALFAGAVYDEAAQKICEASDLDSSAREPYLFAGRIALASPSVAACVPQKLERFLTLQPNDADANYFFAMFLLKHGATPESERVQQLLMKAVLLDPKCSDAYLQLGILSASRKNYPEAIDFYKKALEADPQKGEAHYRLGIAYDRTGDAAQAKAEYQMHEQIDASNAAIVEQQRREVKQFSIVADSPARLQNTN